ncbi:protein PSK SIMULATOR 1-like [Syzygium oleosum]|uniref:protein PSK SIMULATOR 1-like n=1 Tax=Syzygium oleosum TaxID=219896 RepID=UPI0024BBCA30|nr:protein PSK SIMULATOR 1-like [Syzygium oleosum]
MKQSNYTGPFKGCINVETDSPLIDSYCRTEMVESTRATSVSGNDVRMMDYKDVKTLIVSNRIYSKLASFYAKCGCLITPPQTLGHAALAVHYANVIVLIEKLTSSPHLISLDMRDDLYHMLPASIRNALRARLRLHKSLVLMVHDGAIVEKWRTTVAQMLGWLAPLAHNTIKWQSERSFEKQNCDSGANVLLVQTLYFADQPKTEDAIVELLVGLNHICRIGRVKVRAERFFGETKCGT